MILFYPMLRLGHPKNYFLYCNIQYVQDERTRILSNLNIKTSKQCWACSGDNFDDILAEFAALDLPTTDGNGEDKEEKDEAGEKDDSGECKAQHTMARVLESMPPSSESRRNAVLALGSEIHSSLLKINVIPSSALLAAALLPSHVFSTNTPPRRRSATTIATTTSSFATVIANYTWLQTQVNSHKHTCMQLPSAPSTAASAEEFLVHLANACEQYVAYTPAKGLGALATFEIRSTPVAAMWQHARLNYFLPVFSGHALVSSALLRAARASPITEPARGGGRDREHPVMQLVCQNTVTVTVLVNDILWLRQLLSADLDDALGTDALVSRSHVRHRLCFVPAGISVSLFSLCNINIHRFKVSQNSI